MNRTAAASWSLAGCCLFAATAFAGGDAGVLYWFFFAVVSQIICLVWLIRLRIARRPWLAAAYLAAVAAAWALVWDWPGLPVDPVGALLTMGPVAFLLVVKWVNGKL